MPFKRIQYNVSEIFKVRIEDNSGALLENWVFMKEDFPKWVNLIKRKYGIETKKLVEPDKDLDWAL